MRFVRLWRDNDKGVLKEGILYEVYEELAWNYILRVPGTMKREWVPKQYCSEIPALAVAMEQPTLIRRRKK